MQWLVSLDNKGIQAQFKMGKDIEKSAQKEKILDFKLFAKLRVMFVFSDYYEKSDITFLKKYPHCFDGYKNKFQSYLQSINITKEILKEKIDDFYKKENSWSPTEYNMFMMRAQTISDGILILVDVPESTVEKFHKAYSGKEEDLLMSTKKIIKPAKVNDPGKFILKWIKKFELEREDD